MSINGDQTHLQSIIFCCYKEKLRHFCYATIQIKSIIAQNLQLDTFKSRSCDMHHKNRHGRQSQ